MRRLFVIDANGRGRAWRLARRHHHRRQSRRLQQLDDTVRIAQRRRQDHSIDPGRDQPFDRLPLAALGIAFLDHQLDARTAALVQAAEQELAQIGRARVAVEQSDPHRPRAGQTARRRIGRIAELANRLADPLARRRPDVLFTVDDARDSHRRHAGMARHVVDGATALASSGDPLVQYQLTLQSRT